MIGDNLKPLLEEIEKYTREEGKIGGRRRIPEYAWFVAATDAIIKLAECIELPSLYPFQTREDYLKWKSQQERTQ